MMDQFRSSLDSLGNTWLLQEYQSAWGWGWEKVRIIRRASPLDLPWPTEAQLESA